MLLDVSYLLLSVSVAQVPDRADLWDTEISPSALDDRVHLAWNSEGREEWRMEEETRKERRGD